MEISNLWALKDLHEKLWYSFTGKIKFKKISKKNI